MEHNTILLGDCLEILPSIPVGSVDMILCDLPYAVTQAQWDILIPLEQLWAEYKRVIKPKGAIVLTSIQPFTSMLVASNMPWYRHAWVWDKGLVTGFLNAKKAPLRRHEDILVFAEQSPSYYPIMEARDRVAKRPRRGSCELYGEFSRVSGENTERYPTSILYIPQNYDQHIHPTQKPVTLFEYLIQTYSQPGEMILDTCSGSGTTAIASYNTGRQFLCIEQDAQYHALSIERLEQARQSTPPRLFHA